MYRVTLGDQLAAGCNASIFFSFLGDEMTPWPVPAQSPVCTRTWFDRRDVVFGGIPLCMACLASILPRPHAAVIDSRCQR